MCYRYFINIRTELMAQIIVRNLDDQLKARLQMKAEILGHSMEEEVRQIIEKALDDKPSNLGNKIAARFEGLNFDSDNSIFKEQSIKNPEL